MKPKRVLTQTAFNSYFMKQEYLSAMAFSTKTERDHVTSLFLPPSPDESFSFVGFTAVIKFDYDV